jgi:hypothetical protein
MGAVATEDPSPPRQPVHSPGRIHVAYLVILVLAAPGGILATV